MIRQQQEQNRRRVTVNPRRYIVKNNFSLNTLYTSVEGLKFLRLKMSKSKHDTIIIDNL